MRLVPSASHLSILYPPASFHKDCVVRQLSSNNNRCPDCKRHWHVHTFLSFEWPTGEYEVGGGKHTFGLSWFRRFKEWIRYIYEYDEEDADYTFSDLESDSDSTDASDSGYEGSDKIQFL
jgi:hypothetical protein